MSEDRVLKGILDGRRAFIGPEIVQFDITNRCNNNCLCCWRNSPLLGEPTEENKKEKEFELPLGLIRKTIEELKESGTKTLFFAGGGEPFMHADIMEILECAKNNKMRVCINTNFTLLDEEKINKIVSLKIDHIHVSLLAGSSKNYVLIHSNKAEDTFWDIKKLLQYTAKIKQDKNQHLYSPLPHVNLYHVIFNMNYRDIDNMVRLAQEVRADSVEFAPVDIIPRVTDALLLDKEQIAEVCEDIKLQLARIKEYNVHEPVKLRIEQVENFLKRINSPYALEGKYETETITKQPCYAGWAFARIDAKGEVRPCLKAVHVSAGNIYEKSFKEIWNSPEEQLFRMKSFALDSSEPYLQNIGNDPGNIFGCLNSCDNVQINVEMHNKYGEILKRYGRIR